VTMSYKTRADSVFDKYGEEFLINETTSAKGFFQLVNQTRLYTFFDTVEQVSVLRPALLVMTAAEVPVEVGDQITRDERTYSVTKMAMVRVRDVVIFQMLMLT
jgi:hypothetical protein